MRETILMVDDDPLFSMAVGTVTLSFD